MGKNITDFNELLAKTKEISSHDNFDSFCNSRAFEEQIASIEGLIDFSTQLETDIRNYIDQNSLSDNKLCYVLFLTLFTIYRRKKIGDLELFTNTYISKFKQYPFSEFIELLTIYNVKKDNERLRKLLIKSKRLSESKGTTYDFTTHNGIINFYVEVVCTYFELNLDERFNEKSNAYLKDAMGKIDDVINSSDDKVYSKFYLNKGRLEVLTGDYNKGEEYIIKAIQEIAIGESRSYTVNEYEHYLTKLDMIRLNDENNRKIKEVEKIKVDNVKSLSLITALLGFILGTIHIFATVTDIKVLAAMMVTYLGLVLILLGALLFGIKLLYNEKNRKFGFYNIIIFIAGIVIFGTSVLLLI